MDTSVFLRVQLENLEAENARLREQNQTLREWVAELLRSDSVLRETVQTV
jgi:hypothetical protein